MVLKIIEIRNNDTLLLGTNADVPAYHQLLWDSGDSTQCNHVAKCVSDSTMWKEAIASAIACMAHWKNVDRVYLAKLITG